jgi:hypothetical protein
MDYPDWFTDEFEAWWADLAQAEQEEINAKVIFFKSAALYYRVHMQIGSRVLATQT